MNPDEVMVEKIMDILQEDLNKLQQILKTKNLDRKRLDEAFFLVQEIQMYLYKLFSIST
jgi:hypothetical protein